MLTSLRCLQQIAREVQPIDWNRIFALRKRAAAWSWCFDCKSCTISKVNSTRSRFLLPFSGLGYGAALGQRLQWGWCAPKKLHQITFCLEIRLWLSIWRTLLLKDRQAAVRPINLFVPPVLSPWMGDLVLWAPSCTCCFSVLQGCTSLCSVWAWNHGVVSGLSVHFPVLRLMAHIELDPSFCIFQPVSIAKWCLLL